jgi:hypothetical protein
MSAGCGCTGWRSAHVLRVQERETEHERDEQQDERGGGGLHVGGQCELYILWFVQKRHGSVDLYMTWFV